MFKWSGGVLFFILPAFAIRNDVHLDEFPLLMPNARPTLAETYLCTPIRVDGDDTYYVVGFKPNASMHTAHHMLIYGCEEPGSEEYLWNCGEMATKQPGLESYQPCKRGNELIYAWAKDAPMLELPDDVGFRVGKDSSIKYLVLQVHYASVDHIPAKGDDSGVFLEYTSEPQPKTAGVLLMGTGGFALPHTTTYFETSCEVEDEREIHPFAFRTHTHALGKVVSGWRVRNRSNWSLIGKRDPQLPQMFYPVDDPNLVISQGDVIAARCTMVNHRNRITYVGTTGRDEMCNFYIMYWVDGKRPVTPNTCYTRGPPTWSWRNSAGLANIPEEEASTI